MITPTLRSFGAHLFLASTLLSGIALGSPSQADFTLGVRQDGETKTAQLAHQGRTRIHLDFIPVDERASRATRGFPCMAAPDDAYGVEGHGSPASVFCRNGDPMSPEDLAWWISNDSRYHAGMTVYLMCCETGKGDRSFAQRLAEVLGTNVVAPTEKLWPMQDGTYVVAQERKHRKLGLFVTTEQRADMSHLGAMKTFSPKSSSIAANTTTSDSSSGAAPKVETRETPKKPMLRASARTAALLAGVGRIGDNTAFLNSRSR